jgi:hypothetical protein
MSVAEGNTSYTVSICIAPLAAESAQPETVANTANPATAGTSSVN